MSRRPKRSFRNKTVAVRCLQCDSRFRVASEDWKTMQREQGDTAYSVYGGPFKHHCPSCKELRWISKVT